MGGMVETEFYVFFLNAFFPPLVYFLDPWGIIQNFRRWKAFRQFDQDKNNCVLTQTEANLLMEKTDYCTGKRYADIMKTMWFTFAYAPAIHFGAVLSLMGITIYYWVDKFNILRRRVVKENISMDLSIQMIENLEYTVIFFTVFLVPYQVCGLLFPKMACWNILSLIFGDILNWSHLYHCSNASHQ